MEQQEIKKGQHWQHKDTLEIVQVDIVGAASVFLTGERGSFVVLRDGFLESYRPVTVAVEPAAGQDAASLAADMLCDLGYVFNGESWIAPDNCTVIGGHGMVGAALQTLQRLGYQWKGGAQWSPSMGTAPAFSAPDLLDAAAQHMKDRATTYDKPEGERSMAATVAAFNAQTGLQLTEAQGWLLMVNLKIVRDNQRSAPHRDSVEDLIAYGALYGEARLGGAA